MYGPAWVADAVFYEIMPDRFARGSTRRAVGIDEAALEPWDAPPSHHAHKGGDLWGVIDHLDRLRELGVTALYLMPVFTSPTSHRYKPVSHLEVDPLLGGDAALDALLAATHGRGMRVVLDAVFGHVGVGFPRFQDVVEYGPASPWRGWFRIDAFPIRPHGPGAHNYQGWDGHRSMPQLEHENPAVQAYLLDVAEHWVRRGIDGWRLDAPETITAPGFWRAVRERVKAANPEAYLVGECWGDPSPWLDGTQWDGAMGYPLGWLCRVFAAGRHLRREHLLPASRPAAPIDGPGFARELEGALARLPAGALHCQLNLLNSHDLARLTTVAGGDRTSVELATVLLLTLPGAPCLLYGDEVGLAGGLPPACRAALPPPERWDRACLELHRGLITLRHRHPALRRGSCRVLAAAHGAVAFERALPGERLVVAANAGEEPAELVVATVPVNPAWGTAGGSATPGVLRLAPRSALVLGP